MSLFWYRVKTVKLIEFAVVEKGLSIGSDNLMFLKLRKVGVSSFVKYG